MSLTHRSVLVAGGTGFIGSRLCERLVREGCSVTVLTRVSRNSEGPRRYVTWAPDDTTTAASLLARDLEGVSAVINLAGEPVVSGRWGDEVKRRILMSRLNTTRAIVSAIAMAGKKPAVLVNASAVGYYGARVDRPVGEDAPPGADFLAGVCRQWEEEAVKAQFCGVRVVCVRIGMVLEADGGALEKMLPPFKLGLGGPLGSGEQWMSWIHAEDLTELLLRLSDDPSAIGSINGTAPEPVTNEEFSRTLARVLGRPCLFRVPAFVLRLVLGEMSTMLLDGQNAPPKAPRAMGFRFRYPRLEPALRHLLGR